MVEIKVLFRISVNLKSNQEVSLLPPFNNNAHSRLNNKKKQEQIVLKRSARLKLENIWAVLCCSGLYCAEVGCAELCWATIARGGVHRVDRENEVCGDDRSVQRRRRRKRRRRRCHHGGTNEQGKIELLSHGPWTAEMSNWSEKGFSLYGFVN